MRKALRENKWSVSYSVGEVVLAFCVQVGNGFGVASSEAAPLSAPAQHEPALDHHLRRRRNAASLCSFSPAPVCRHPKGISRCGRHLLPRAREWILFIPVTRTCGPERGSLQHHLGGQREQNLGILTRTKAWAYRLLVIRCTWGTLELKGPIAAVSESMVTFSCALYIAWLVLLATSPILRTPRGPPTVSWLT